MKNLISYWKSMIRKALKAEDTVNVRKNDVEKIVFKSEKRRKVSALSSLQKYLFPLLLVFICYTKKHSESYLVFQTMELAIIILLTECIRNRFIRRTINTVLLLLFNVQLVVMIFGTTYVSWVMLSNLSSLKDISGHGIIYMVAITLVVIDLFLPMGSIYMIKTNSCSDQNQSNIFPYKFLAIVLALELAFTMCLGAEFSPLYNVYATASDGCEFVAKAREYANTEVDAGEFYHEGVDDRIAKPELLPDNPNIILIFTEGLSQNIVTDERNITPNIRKYEEQSLNFTNYYNHTFATYYGLQGQLYSGYSWSLGEPNNLISLQDILSDNGYHTTFINTEPNNYQFLKYLESFDFDELVTDSDEDCTGLVASLSDGQAYDKLWEVVSEESESGQPFFSAIYTFGTHASFDSTEEMYGDGSNALLNKFYNMDYQFGKFMEKFEKSEMADNTIIIFTADHCTYEEEDYTNTFLDYERESYECDKIPLFFYYKGMESTEWDTGGSTSIALAPTILDYLDISGPNYFMGSSLFSDIWSKSIFNSVFAEASNIYETSHGIEVLSDAEMDMIGDKLERYYILEQQ